MTVCLVVLLSKPDYIWILCERRDIVQDERILNVMLLHITVEFLMRIIRSDVVYLKNGVFFNSTQTGIATSRPMTV